VQPCCPKSNTVHLIIILVVSCDNLYQETADARTLQNSPKQPDSRITFSLGVVAKNFPVATVKSVLEATDGAVGVNGNCRRM